MCWYSAHRNPQTSPHLTCQTRTHHSASSIAHTTRSLCLLMCPFPPQPPLLWVSDWQEVRDTVKPCLSVPDSLQRDANQVHLPATQCLLAAHHASEQRGRSLQLPRYGRVVLLLIVMCASSLFLSQRVALFRRVWKRLMVHPAMKELARLPQHFCPDHIYSFWGCKQTKKKYNIHNTPQLL